MEKPNIENYKLGKTFHTHDFVSDLTLYSDQVEAEKKELIESMQNGLDCIEYMNGLTQVDDRDQEHYANRVMNAMAQLMDEINKLKQ